MCLWSFGSSVDFSARAGWWCAGLGLLQLGPRGCPPNGIGPSDRLSVPVVVMAAFRERVEVYRSWNWQVMAAAGYWPVQVTRPAHTMLVTQQRAWTQGSQRSEPPALSVCCGCLHWFRPCDSSLRRPSSFSAKISASPCGRP